MNPWDRKAGEPMLWYSRFDEFYREAGPERSLLGAYKAWRAEKGEIKRKATSASSPWERAFKQWKWRERAEAWDHYQQVRRMQAEQTEIDAMNKRHLQIAVGLQSAGGRSLQKLAEALKDDPDMRLKDGEIRLFLSQGIDLERTTRGLPTELIKIMGMSDEELLKAYRDSRGAPGPVDRSRAEGPGAAEDSDESD